MHTTAAYLTVFHAQYINMHLQSRLDTHFNKDTHRAVLYIFSLRPRQRKTKGI